MSLTEPCLTTGCHGTADPYGRSLGYCGPCFETRAINTCSACNGRGFHEWSAAPHRDDPRYRYACTKCSGTGDEERAAFALTLYGKAVVELYRTDPPRGGCAAWIRNPERWQPQQEQAA